MRPVRVCEVRTVRLAIVQRGPRTCAFSGVMGADKLSVDAIVNAEIVISAKTPLVSVLGNRITDICSPYCCQIRRDPSGCRVISGDCCFQLAHRLNA
jgi:hypothetical protein